ncbi:hypothetical protein F4801DRAFT_578843 [Xylaria longipes]|nr:hypothetical protein F4801DRAFT_578843 [Xylaria longipes]
MTSATNPSRFRWHLLRSAQTPCRPGYNVSIYEIYQVMGHVPTFALAQDPQTRKINIVENWDFTQAIIDAYSSVSVQRVGILKTDVLGTIKGEDLSSDFSEVYLDDYSIAILRFGAKSFLDVSSV